MRNGQNKRMRGRNRNHKSHHSSGGGGGGGGGHHHNPLTRVYESNGPEVKIRGTAHHIAEKYLQLARDAQGSGDPVTAENHFQQALKSLFAVAEAYPQLQANQNFLQLQAELVDTEDKIQASRRFYNGGVRELNTKIKVFPNTLFVRGLGFTEREFFEVDEPSAIAEPPKVQF